MLTCGLAVVLSPCRSLAIYVQALPSRATPPIAHGVGGLGWSGSLDSSQRLVRRLLKISDVMGNEQGGNPQPSAVG